MTNPSPRGFTLIETLIAITILAVALTGPFMAVRNALKSSYIARDQLVAAALAQEGMEYVRMIRDDNFLADRAWMHFPYACAAASPTQHCSVDATQGDFHTNSSAVQSYAQFSGIPRLNLSSTNLYNQQGTPNTVFTRGVQIRVLSPTEVRVTVTVTWIAGGTTYTATVVDTLNDWL